MTDTFEAPEIISGYPPIWDRVIEAGMQPNVNTVVFAFAPYIYAPVMHPESIPDDIIVHEMTHIEQQGDDPSAWWNRYLTDPYFRIDQEAEAYAEQYRFICASQKDRNRRALLLHRMAVILCGPTYGKVLSYSSARDMIKSKAGNV